MFTLIAATQELDIRTAGQAVKLPGYETATTADAGFAEFVGTILTALLAIVALLLILYLLWAGIEWITAGGDSGKISNARNKITQAIIGLIVFASTFAIISAVQSALDLDLIKFGSSKTKTSSDIENWNKTINTKKVNPNLETPEIKKVAPNLDN